MLTFSSMKSSCCFLEGKSFFKAGPTPPFLTSPRPVSVGPAASGEALDVPTRRPASAAFARLPSRTQRQHLSGYFGITAPMF